MTDRSWSFILAIPRKKGSVFAAEGVKRLNLIRNIPEKQAQAWSYLEPSYYAASLFRMGFVHLAKPGKSADFKLEKDFKKRGKRELWMQNMPSVKKEKCVRLEGKEAYLFSEKSSVQYMTLISPEIRYGDKIRFEFTARGSGKGGVGLYFYSAYGKSAARWHGIHTEFFDAGSVPKIYSIVVDTGKLPAKYFDTLRCRPFLAAQKGAKIRFSDVRFSVVK